MNIKRASGDIGYEIETFLFTSNTLLSHGLPQSVVNVLLESFAIHTRNLFFFFYTETNARKKDDVLASDYPIDKKRFKGLRTKKTLLNYIPKRVAKQVAHLTYHRSVYNKRTKPWKVLDIKNKMTKTIDAFMVSLPEEQRKWFKLQ